MGHNESVLRNGERLHAGEYLRSKNGLFHALMQDDGNLVIYRGDLFKTKAPGYEKTGLWSVWPHGKAPAGGTGYHVYMQTDGNLCIYRQEPYSVPWCCPETAKKTEKDSKRFLEMKDNGRLDIHNIWDTDISEGFGDFEFERVEYILDPKPKITALGPPSASLSDVASNIKGLDVQTSELLMTRTQSTSWTWKNSTSLKVSASSKTTLTIPFIGKEEVSVTTEVVDSFEFGRTTQETTAIAVKLTVRVPQGKAIIGTCTWQESSLSIPYRAIGKVKFDGYPEKLPVTLEGMFEGSMTHNVVTAWKDVTDEIKANPIDAIGEASVEMFGADGWNVVAADSGKMTEEPVTH